MPNGHLIYPVWTAPQVSDAVSSTVRVMKAFNGTTGLSYFLWLFFALTIVIAVYGAVRRWM